MKESFAGSAVFSTFTTLAVSNVKTLGTGMSAAVTPVASLQLSNVVSSRML